MIRRRSAIGITSMITSWCLLWSPEKAAAAFVASPSPSSSSSSLCHEKQQVPCTSTTTALHLLAEPPMEERKKRRNDDDDPNWTPKSGGFLPKLPFTKKNKSAAKGIISKIASLEDFKQHVVDEPTAPYIVVFWLAPWCKMCKAMAPKLKQLARSTNSVVAFYQVPVVQATELLHHGLGVPSVPYAHIYHSEVGLVDEHKIGKQDFAAFAAMLQTYVDGECALPSLSLSPSLVDEEAGAESEESGLGDFQ